jgi:hypothetical protein
MWRRTQAIFYNGEIFAMAGGSEAHSRDSSQRMSQIWLPVSSFGLRHSNLGRTLTQWTT